MKPITIPSLPRLLAAGVLGGACGIAYAQPVIGPVTPSSSGTPVIEHKTDKSKRKAPSSLFEANMPPTLPLAKWGIVAVRPNATYRILQCDGLLNATQTEDDSSLVQTAAAGVVFDIGENWTVSYTNSHTFYSNRFFRDEVGHDGSVKGSLTRGKWVSSLSFGYSNTTHTLIETATQTPQESYTTEVTLSYALGQRTTLTTTAALASRDVSEFSAAPEWTTADWDSWTATEMLHYRFSSRLDLGAGVAVGYDSINPGSDMSHSQPQAQMTWRPSEKLSVALRGGIETRKVKGADSNSTTNPVYRAALQYSPVGTTSLSVSATRGFAASYFANRATRNTGWSSTVQQRLVGRVYVSVDYGENETRYSITGIGPVIDRSDKVETFGARVSTPFIRRGSLSLIYQHGRNRSNVLGYSFDSQQAGGEVSYRF